MTKEALFQKTKSIWPKKISLKALKNVRSDVHLEISEYYEAIEKEIRSSSDGLLQVANWVIAQCLGLNANQNQLNKPFDLYLDTIEFRDFDRLMRLNLEEECWKLEKKVYEGMG